MAVSRIILVEPDPFMGTANKVSGYVPSYNKKGVTSEDRKKISDEVGFNIDDIQQVSRPLRGISAKPETHAFVQVIRSDGKIIKVFNKIGQDAFDMQNANSTGSAPRPLRMVEDPAIESLSSEKQSLDEPNSAAWTDWILQSVNESRVEKTQLVETFGSTYLYAFGQKPRSLAFNGLLMNTADYNWRAIFWRNWDEFFRATRLVELNARMYISWDDIVVEGYPINAVCSQTADSPNALTFSFNFFVTRYINIDADRGFRRLQGDNVSVLTTGYDGGTPKLRYNNRISAIELLGLTGATYTGGLTEKALLEGMGGTATETQKALAAVAGKNVSNAHRALLTGTLAAARGSYNGAAFLRAFLRKSGYDFTRDLTNIAFQELERSTGVRKSDVNAFFGLLATLLYDVPGLRQSDAGRLLLHGSVDRVIQGMAYHRFDIGNLGVGRPGTAVAVNRSGVNDTGVGVFPQSVAGGFVTALGGLLLTAGTAAATGSVALGEVLELERDSRFGVESVEI